MSLIRRIGLTGLLFFLSSLVLYYALTYSIGDAFDFKKAIPFIRQSPMVYIASVTFALVLTLVIFDGKLLRQKGFRNIVTIILFLVLWLSVSIILGGIVWAYHDMGDSHYIGGYTSFAGKAIKNIEDAIFFGPMVLLAAFPFNVLCLLILYFLINRFYGN